MTLTASPHASGLRESQVQSVFHDLKRSASAQDLAPPTDEEYQAFLRSLRGSLTPSEQQQVDERLHKAAAGPVPDGGTYQAMTALRSQAVAAQASLRSALRNTAKDRLGDLSAVNDSSRRFLINGETRLTQARYEAFRAQAENDRNLRAPEGFVEQARSRRSTAATPGDRVTAYALWRTSTSGEDFAPPAPEGSAYTRQVASYYDMRPGDVLAEPGYRDTRDAPLEGKVVARVTGNRDANEPATVLFTDGTSVSRHAGNFDVMRPMTPHQEAELARYRKVQARSRVGGRDASGWWVEDPDTGEWVYAP